MQITKHPVPEPPVTYTVELSQEEARLLRLLAGRIGGEAIRFLNKNYSLVDHLSWGAQTDNDVKPLMAGFYDGLRA